MFVSVLILIELQRKSRKSFDVKLLNIYVCAVRVINVNFYQILVHVTVIFRNLMILVCITFKDKLIIHLYNSHLRKLPIAHGEVSVMRNDLYFAMLFYCRGGNLEAMNV